MDLTSAFQTIRNQFSTWFEPFQNPTGPSKAPSPSASFNGSVVESSKQSISTFFTWWNQLPSEFLKSTDILTIVNKWKPYTSPVAPYILPAFASLDTTTYQILQTDFTNAYVFSLIDTYIALQKRHSTKPLTPLPKPQTVPKDAKSDRLLAAKGDRTIQGFYTKSYYPSLYTSIRTQLVSIFKIIDIVLSKSSQEERDVAKRLLPNQKEDQAELQKKVEPMAAILKVSNLYSTYSVRGRQYLPGGEKYAAVEFEYRNTLQARIDKFLVYFYENATRDTDTPVAKAGIAIPLELAKLPTSLSLNSKSLLELLQIEGVYFGPKGVEKKVNSLIAEAVLENRRNSVESLLRTFAQTYTDLSAYCSPTEFPQEVKDANTLLPTYWKEVRQKGLTALPLGTEADRTAKDISSLYALEGRFLMAFQKITLFSIQCFTRIAAEKAGNQRKWNPHPTLTSAIEQPAVLPSKLDVDTITDIRNTYVQLWIYLDRAARDQFQSQYTAYSKLVDFAQLVGISSSKRPFPTGKQLYELNAEYNELDRVGTQVLEQVKQLFSNTITETSNLYTQIDAFISDPEIQNLVSLQPLRDSVGNNTSQEDLQTFQQVSFYTSNLFTLLQDVHLQYIAEPGGRLPRLRSFAQTQLQRVIDAFKKQWDSYGMKPYPTYAADKKSVMTPEMNSNQLQSLMDRYRIYVQKTQSIEGLQEFTSSLRDLRKYYELFGSLYQQNKSWLPTVLPPEIQQTVDTYGADADAIENSKSIQALSSMVERYTNATRALWLFLTTFLPQTYFDPYTMLYVEYSIYSQVQKTTVKLPVESIEKERLLFQSFLEPSTAFQDWLTRFRTRYIEDAFPKLQSFLLNQLSLYTSTVANPPKLYTSTPNEIRDTLHDISVSLAKESLEDTKSRVFQLLSRVLQIKGQDVGVETVLSQIQSTDDTHFILVQEAKYRTLLLQLEATEEVRSILQTLDVKELQDAHKEFQTATGVPALPEPNLTAFESQLRSYISTFWERYTNSTSRTRDMLIPSKSDMPILANKQEILQQSKKYAELTRLLDLADQQEAVLATIDQFKGRLYTPNLGILPERPLHLMKLAFDADAARWKCKITRNTGELDELRKTYEGASQEWLGLLQSTLLADLRSFSQLYTVYTEFDKEYSTFYDLEPIPASFHVQVNDDIAFVESMPKEYSPTVEGRINTIRKVYYFFPETSQFPTFVRFVKAQLYSYLQMYIREYDKVESAIQPTKLPIASLQGRILPAIYTAVSNLQDLLQSIEQLKTATKELQSAIALQTKKESVRTMLDSLEDLMAYFREQIQFVQFSKIDINIPQMRIDLQYAERKEDIDGKYELLASAFATLASEALRTFNTEYSKNIALRSYFYREAVEVLNAFTLYFTEDVEHVATNTPVDNEQLAKQYVGYTKIIKDAVPAAAVVQDTTEKYRRETLMRLQQVQGILEQVADIKEIQKPSLDISGAITVVENASYVHEMEPTRNAYDQIYRDLVSSVHTYTQTSIQAWRSLYTSLDPFTKWLPPNQQAIAERAETPTGKSIDVSLNLARKYIRYRSELAQYIVPNGVFFSKARLDVQTKIDKYLETVRLVADLSGALPPHDSSLQDKKTVQTATLKELQSVYAKYTTAEEVLLENVSKFATRVLKDMFLLNNKTLQIPEYAVARERATFLLPLLEQHSIPIASIVAELNYYGSLLSRVDISLQRLKVLQLLDELEKDIDDLDLHGVAIDVLSEDQLNVERSRVQTITNADELEHASTLYQSYKNRIQSQLNEWAIQPLKEYEELYKNVQKDGSIGEFDKQFVAGYTQLEAVRTEILRGTSIQRRVEIRSFYVGILEKAKQLRSVLMTKKEVETKSLWKEQQTKRLETSAAMQRFLDTYQTHRISYPLKIRQAIRETSADLDRIQKTTVRSELDALLQKYTRLLEEIGILVEEERIKRIEATLLLIRRFRALYIPHIPSIHSFPPYLQIDIRILDRDLATLQKAPDTVIVDGLFTQYTGYTNALTAYLKENGIVVGAEVQAKKAEVRKRIGELNSLFLANTAVFDEFSIEIQRKVRAIPGDLQYLENPTLTREEVVEILQVYETAVRQMKKELSEIEEDEENTALLPSLEKIQALFQSRFESIDSTTIPATEMPFFQALLRGIENPAIRSDARQGIAAYTEGLRKLSVLPKTSERRIENTPFDALQEVIGYFQNEYKIRNVSAFIPADRLLLSGLRKDATAYLNLYKTPPPNMRNYVEIVGQVVKQYWDGLRILRTYPLV